MSVSQTPSQVSTSEFAQKRLGFMGVLRSEILKFRTLTTNWVMTLVIAAVVIGLALLGSLLVNTLYNDALSTAQGSGAPAGLAQDTAAENLRSMVFSSGAMGIDMANMLIASVAVVFIAAEYATRSINTTLTVVPKRSMVYLAKLFVLSMYGFITGVVFSALGFIFSYMLLQAEIRERFPIEAGVWLNCIGVGIYFMMLTWMGLGFGALMRNNAAGIVLVVFCLFILPIVLGLFTMGFEWAKTFLDYAPNSLGRQMLAYQLADDAKFNNVEAGGLLAVWCLVPALLGYLRIRFTDPK